MSRTDGRPTGSRGARRREGAAAAGTGGRAVPAVGTGDSPAVGGPAGSATLARGVFWRGATASSRGVVWRSGRTRAAAALTGLTAGLALPLFPAGPAYAALPAVDRYVVRAEAGELDAALTAVSRSGGSVQQLVPLIGGAVVTLPPASVPTLAGLSSVAAVTPDVTVEMTQPAASYDPTSDPYSLHRSERNSGVLDAWARGYTGKGVTVAVIDSGISAVPGLDAPGKTTPGIDLSFDAVDDAKRNKDGYGHGTHLGGIIAGDDADGKAAKRSPSTFQGVAPDAKLVGVKIGDGEGRVDVSQVLAGLDWVVATKDRTGVRVVNLSFNAGGLQSYTLDPLSFAVERAWKAGLVVVVSAGNDGDALGRLQNPAQNPYVLAVGAVDDKGTASREDDVVPSFSAKGDGLRNPDLVAPGRSVQSLVAPASFAAKHAQRAGTRFVRASGTSQSAAFVSGAAAVLLGQRPELTPDQVKRLLTSTAQALPRTPATRQGAGALDLKAALAAPTPGSEAVQTHVPSTGLGSLDLSRGDRRLVVDGRLLSGEKDVWGQPFDATTVGGTLTGSLSGASWSGASWSGASWSGASWSGASWSGASWSGASWSGASWSGASWSGASWSGASWSGASWS